MDATIRPRHGVDARRRDGLGRVIERGDTPISSASRRAPSPSTSPIATMRISGAPAAMRRA
jgi:hypothetical protein